MNENHTGAAETGGAVEPCPFCGSRRFQRLTVSDDTPLGTHDVTRCNKCFGEAPANGWNTRAPVVSSQAGEELGSSEPFGPHYDGTTMDNQQLHGTTRRNQTVVTARRDWHLITEDSDGEQSTE
jgi:hypothetical protein